MADANQQTPVTATAKSQFTSVDIWLVVFVAEAQEDWHLGEQSEEAAGLDLP